MTSTPDTVSTSWTQQNTDPHTTHKILNNHWPKVKSSILMPSDIHVQRQVPVNNAKILEETKFTLHKLLKRFDSVISKSDNDIGQMDLMEICTLLPGQTLPKLQPNYITWPLSITTS